jgi:hypothetical protein
VVTPDIRYPRAASYLAFPFGDYAADLGFDPGADTFMVPAMDNDVPIYGSFDYRAWVADNRLSS